MLDVLGLNNPIPKIETTISNIEHIILCITDLHWMLKLSSKNRDHQAIWLQQSSIQGSLYNIIKENNINTVIYGGDIWNGGTKDKDSKALDDSLEYLLEVSKIAKQYTNFGNHEYTFGDNNPFYQFTEITHPQVLDILKNSSFQKRPVIAPLMRCVPMLDFGSVHIHFIPYHPRTRDFVVQDNAPYNIGIFHNDYISMESKEAYFHHKTGHGLSIYGNNLFESFNVAILNHLHKPFTPFTLNNIRKTLVITPGSCCQKAIDEIHSKVNLPVFVFGDGRVEQVFLTLNLGNIQDTIKEDVVEKERTKREVRKFIKRNQQQVNTKSFETLLQETDNQKIRSILASSSSYNPPTSILRYYNPKKYGMNFKED